MVDLWRRAIRWWIFVPFAPVVIMVLLDICISVCDHLGLPKLSSAADALSLLNTVVPMASYWVVCIVFFGMTGNTPYALQVVELLAVSVCYCAALYCFSLFIQVLVSRRWHAKPSNQAMHRTAPR